LPRSDWSEYKYHIKHNTKYKNDNSKSSHEAWDNNRTGDVGVSSV